VAGRGFEIAEGYLEIDADTTNALKDVNKFFAEVDGELAAEEKAFKRSGEKSGRQFTDSLASAIDSKRSGFKPMRDILKDMDREAAYAAHDIGEHLVSGIERAFSGGGGGRNRRGLLSRLLPGGAGGGRGLFARFASGISNLFSAGSKFFSSVVSGISDAFSTGLDQAKSIWKNVSSVFSQIGSVAGGIGGVAQFAAIGLAIPLILELAGALVQLSAALLAVPAGISVLLAAIAPLIIAFHGFGEAVGAGLSGDVDKFNEALKGLAPNARKVAKEIVGLKKYFSDIKNSVQNAFFGPLVGQFAKLGTTVLPVLKTGLTLVAGALGRIAAGFLQLLSTPAAVQTLNNLFATTARILDVFGPALVNTFGAFLNLINAGLPWVERFNVVLSGGLQHVADWINQAVAPGGKFTGWMERAWHIGKELWEVIKQLGIYAFTLLNSFGDEGTDTLTGMANALKKVNDYLKTPQGAETLHNLGDIVHWAGDAFVFLLDHATSTFRALNALFNFVRGIGPFFSRLGSDIADFARGVGHWFADLGRTIWGGITTAISAVGSFFDMIGHGFMVAWRAVVGAGGAVVSWFASLPGIIGNFVTSIPGYLAQFAQYLYNGILYGIGYVAGLLTRFLFIDMPNWFAQGWNWAVQATTNGVNWVINWITTLPERTGALLASFGSTVLGWFTTAWESAKNTTVNGLETVILWVSALPSRISAMLSGLRDAIGGWFSRSWNSAKDATISGYMTIVAWINRIPGAIMGALSGAGSWLYNAGRDVIRGLVNGVRDALGWAVNAAEAAARRIADGFKHGLGISSPSRVMRVEVGRWLLPGAMQGVEDTVPQFRRYLGTTADMIAGDMRPVVNVGAPNVSVGGTTLIADLGDGIRQAVPLQIMRNSDVVATAANVGNRQRAAWSNTARTVITGTG